MFPRERHDLILAGKRCRVVDLDRQARQARQKINGLCFGDEFARWRKQRAAKPKGSRRSRDDWRRLLAKPESFPM